MGLGSAGPARLAMGLSTVWSHNLLGRHNSRLCSYYVRTEYGGNINVVPLINYFMVDSATYVVL